MTKTGRTENDAWWETLKRGVKDCAKNEPALAMFFQKNVLEHSTFAEALATILAGKLADNDPVMELGRDQLAGYFRACYEADPRLIEMAKEDLKAVEDRDPAVDNARTPLLYFKGYHALQTHRLAHYAWGGKQRSMARFLQSQCSSRFQVDIHPAARLGKRLMMDHATGIVIGETAVVGNDVSMLHNVTLGGTGKEGEDRHPKIGDGVLLGAGAKVLGNIHVGKGSRIAAGSVVLMPVPAHVTVAGVPAKLVGKAGCAKPGTVMDQVPEFPETPAGKLPSLAAAKR